MVAGPNILKPNNRQEPVRWIRIQRIRLWEPLIVTNESGRVQ